MVGPPLPVPQLELPPSCQELHGGGALGAVGCACASLSFDHQSWPSHAYPCPLPSKGVLPAQIQVIIHYRGRRERCDTGRRTVLPWGKRHFDSNIDETREWWGFEWQESQEEGSELVVAHLYNPSIQDTEVGRLCSSHSEFQVSPGYIESPFLKRWRKRWLSD